MFVKVAQKLKGALMHTSNGSQNEGPNNNTAGTAPNLKCKINGKEVVVKEGTSIIEAFKQCEEDIAHYCYHPGLSIAGVCRLCMVEVGGQEKLQIACNTLVKEGMEIYNNSPKVKEAVKWGLDFHLINHPLDCPVCDQAGECQLQIQYMKFGQYDPEMSETKVKKKKVVDLGSKVVLDSERCILCSRCVRFTTEVSKTNELGIFHRGDRSDIGTFAGKPLDNNYSVNTVDICPVGALTSKDFRFRQRVWYLKEGESLCSGCSTGCNVKVYYNEEGVFRVQPVENQEVNGFWMCDEGRDIYKRVNIETRSTEGKIGQGDQWKSLSAGAVARSVGEWLGADVQEGAKVAVVVTGQQSCEDYEALVGFTQSTLKSASIYHWKNNPESFDDFDGLLMRGDKNPNTAGLTRALLNSGLEKPWAELEAQLQSGELETLIVLAPENEDVYPDFEAQLKNFSRAKKLVWLGSRKTSQLEAVDTPTWIIPTKSYIETSGTFVNFSGREQVFKKVTQIVKGALSISDALKLFAEQEVLPEAVMKPHLKANHFVHHKGGGL